MLKSTYDEKTVWWKRVLWTEGLINRILRNLSKKTQNGLPQIINLVSSDPSPVNVD